MEDNKPMMEDALKELVSKTVHETLFQIGVIVDDNDDVVEFRKDMAHLRKWRKAVEQAESKGFLTIVGILATGLLATIWMGIQTIIGHH